MITETRATARLISSRMTSSIPKALAVAMAEVASLEKKLKPGLVRDIGHDGQSVFFPHERRKNRATWIHEGSKTLGLFPRCALVGAQRGTTLRARPRAALPDYPAVLGAASAGVDLHDGRPLRLSRRRRCAGVNLTAIVFLARNPKKVRGGDIVLSYDDEETVIPFKHNRLLVFPSKTIHRVTKVRIASGGPARRAHLTAVLARLRDEPDEEDEAGRRSLPTRRRFSSPRSPSSRRRRRSVASSRAPAQPVRSGLLGRVLSLAHPRRESSVPGRGAAGQAGQSRHVLGPIRVRATRRPRGLRSPPPRAVEEAIKRRRPRRLPSFAAPKLRAVGSTQPLRRAWWRQNRQGENEGRAPAISRERQATDAVRLLERLLSS